MTSSVYVQYVSIHQNAHTVYGACIVVKGCNPIFGWADINQHNLEGGEPVDILVTGPFTA